MNTYSRPHVKKIMNSIWRNVTLNRMLSRRFDDAETAVSLMRDIIDATIRGNETGLKFEHALVTTDKNVKQYHFSLMNDQLGCVISGIIEVMYNGTFKDPYRECDLALFMHDEWND